MTLKAGNALVPTYKWGKKKQRLPSHFHGPHGIQLEQTKLPCTGTLSVEEACMLTQGLHHQDNPHSHNVGPSHLWGLEYCKARGGQLQ